MAKKVATKVDLPADALPIYPPLKVGGQTLVMPSADWHAMSYWMTRAAIAAGYECRKNQQGITLPLNKSGRKALCCIQARQPLQGALYIKIPCTGSDTSELDGKVALAWKKADHAGTSSKIEPVINVNDHKDPRAKQMASLAFRLAAKVSFSSAYLELDRKLAELTD